MYSGTFKVCFCKYFLNMNAIHSCLLFKIKNTFRNIGKLLMTREPEL